MGDAIGESLFDLLADEAPAEQVGLPPSLYEPRPDLTADSALWQRILALAFAADGEQADGAFGVLHGSRCCGATLVQDGRVGGLRIVGTGYDGDWAADRERWLLPHRAQIAGVLRQAGALP